MVIFVLLSITHRTPGSIDTMANRCLPFMTTHRTQPPCLIIRADFPNRKQIVHEILHPEDRPSPQSSYSHYSGINYSALEVAVRRIQQDFDFLMRYLPKLPDDSYAKTETLKILKQHKAYMAQFEEMLNDKEIA